MSKHVKQSSKGGSDKGTDKLTTAAANTADKPAGAADEEDEKADKPSSLKSTKHLRVKTQHVRVASSVAVLGSSSPMRKAKLDSPVSRFRKKSRSVGDELPGDASATSDSSAGGSRPGSSDGQRRDKQAFSFGNGEQKQAPVPAGSSQDQPPTARTAELNRLRQREQEGRECC